MSSEFNWQREPEAEALVLNFLNRIGNPFLEGLKMALAKTCSTGLIEWVDHICMAHSEAIDRVGFKEIASGIYRHPGADLPDIVIGEPRVALHVDSIADFLGVRGLHRAIEGTSFSGFRVAKVFNDLWVVERRGVVGVEPTVEPNSRLHDYFLAKEIWKTRSRSLHNEEGDFLQAERDAEKIVKLMGKDQAACLILECEREYWQVRNLAGQIQKNRQDRLGMGWANHDHHTFRSSRKFFHRLVKLFETLGFHCRERYYAGAEAGWGAQIMENPRAKLVLFLDVDLHPGEIDIDFAHESLPEKEELGTIGLWVALHGDSILRAGMHHLEAQFSFQDLKADLAHLGIGMMDPFSDFPFLKQAFTHGEIWGVDKERIHALLSTGKISPQEAEKFSLHGAIGSHMENLQRKEGYKGFNQKNVSTIIKKTDPRL